jgi:hypothetical protein
MNEITTKMRTERDTIHSRNEALLEEFTNKNKEWEEEESKAANLFLDTLDVPYEQREALYSRKESDYHSFYKIEDIVFIG